MKEIDPVQHYREGKAVPAQAWNKNLPFFGEVVWPEYKQERTTAQLDLTGEVHWKRIRPTETPEMERLKRPSDTREGRREIERRAAQTNKTK